MTFTGDLKNISLGDVFQNIQGNRGTGTLQLQVRGNKRFVYFLEGMVAGYSIGLRKGLPLRETFLQRQWLSEEEFERAYKRKQKSNKTMAEVCEELKLMDAEQFRDHLAEVMQEHLYDLMAIREASFEFLEGKPLARAFDTEQQRAHLRIDPSGILMEGARRADEMSRIEQVVTSEQDLFVILEGYEDVELDEVQSAAVEYLDGNTEVKVLLECLPYSRFDVLKAIHDLVKEDVCRPLSGREVESKVSEALAEGDEAEAIALLRRSLMVERSNHEQRERLVELLERGELHEEAAAELAILGHQAATRGALDEAIEHYGRAVELHPSDIGLHERRVSLLRQHDADEHHSALLEYSEQLLAAGLADKARGLLQAALEDCSIEFRQDLQLRLADVDQQLGRTEEAAAIYRGLAEELPKDDDEGRLIWLEKAAALLPGDQELAEEVEFLASGQALRRRRRRRMFTLAAVAASVLVAVICAGVIEMRASHSLIRSFGEGLEDLSAGDAVTAMGSLQKVEDEYTWTLAGHRAGELRSKMFRISLARFEAMVARGEILEARQALERLMQQGTQEDERKQLQALVERVRSEARARELFALINAPRPDEDAASEFVSQADPVPFDYYLRRLEDHQGLRPRAELALLQVLRQLDNPRCIPAVTRCYLRADDSQVLAAAAEILKTAEKHRKAGRAAAWASVLPQLQAASSDPQMAHRVAELTVWLVPEKQ